MPQVLATVPFPLQTPKTAARLFRGYTMGAIRDGWLCIYEHEEKRATEDLVDELCIVFTAEHRCLLRFLKKGRKPNTWDLLTESGPPMTDVVLLWAAKVTIIVPFKPSDELSATMSETY